ASMELGGAAPLGLWAELLRNLATAMAPVPADAQWPEDLAALVPSLPARLRRAPRAPPPPPHPRPPRAPPPPAPGDPPQHAPASRGRGPPRLAPPRPPGRWRCSSKPPPSPTATASSCSPTSLDGLRRLRC